MLQGLNHSTSRVILPKFVRQVFPTFDEIQDLSTWISACELFFEKYRIKEHNKVFLASHLFKDGAEVWFNEVKKEHRQCTWKDFKSALLARFCFHSMGSRRFKFLFISFSNFRI